MLKKLADNADLSLQGKTLLVINTGYKNKEFIFQKYKELGLNIIVMNPEKNWADPYVDKWIISDLTNHIECLLKLEKFIKDNKDLKIDGVLTFWEDNVILASKIADKFGFIGIPFEVSNIVRNKYKFRELCHKHNIPAPKHRLVRNSKDLSFVIDNFTFPLILKPTFGCVSSHVMKVNNKEELLEKYDYLMKNLSVDSLTSLSDGLDIMVEEYIDGSEVDIDMLIQDGEVKFYCITDNLQTHEPYFVETGDIVPSILPQDNQINLYKLAEETVKKSGIKDACLHFEAKSSSRGSVPIEINMRMGGDDVYKLVKGVWDVDLVENAAKIALGIEVNIAKLAKPLKYVMTKRFLPEQSGQIEKIEISQEIYDKDFVYDFCFLKNEKDNVYAPPHGYDYLGWIGITGQDLQEATDNLKEAMDYVKYDINPVENNL